MPALRSKNAFLDTSVIISREFSSQQTKKRIAKIVDPLNKYTTPIAVTEINRSLVKDAVFLHSLLIEEMNLPKVYNRLTRYPLSDRGRKRCLLLLEKISDKRQLRVADAVVRLESLINGLHALLMRDVTLLNSKIGCPIANVRPIKVNRIYEMPISCRRKNARCSVDQFLAYYKDALNKILALVMFDQNLSNTVTSVTKSFNVAKGKNCARLGDIIICLEAPDDHTIYSTNKEDFDPICKALGKKLICP
jgi:predicted nucleic acid-binding protein